MDICKAAKPVEYKESEFLKSTISQLIMSHNTFCYIIGLFNSNEILNVKYHEVLHDMMKDGNSSMGVAMVEAIKSLVNELEELRSKS